MRNLWSCLLFNAVLTLPVIALPLPAMPQSAVATSEATPTCKDEKGCIKQFPNVFLRKKNVLWLKLQNGKATGQYEDFMTGFVAADANVWGRPVGIAVAQDGSLLMSDDGSGTIWRIAYGASKQAAH